MMINTTKQRCSSNLNTNTFLALPHYCIYVIEQREHRNTTQKQMSLILKDKGVNRNNEFLTGRGLCIVTLRSLFIHIYMVQ